MTTDALTWTGRELDDPRVRRLPRSALLVWQIENALAGALVVAGVLALSAAPFVPTGWRRWTLPVLLFVLALTAVEALLVAPLRHRYYRYALLDDHLLVARGRTLVRRSVFPLHQILYVDARQGPVLRPFGLVTLQIGTLAEPHTLGPLPAAEADRVQRALGPRAEPP